MAILKAFSNLIKAKSAAKAARHSMKMAEKAQKAKLMNSAARNKAKLIQSKALLKQASASSKALVKSAKAIKSQARLKALTKIRMAESAAQAVHSAFNPSYTNNSVTQTMTKEGISL